MVASLEKFDLSGLISRVRAGDGYADFARRFMPFDSVRCFVFACLIFCTSFFSSLAVSAEYPNENITYAPDIRTVQLYKSGFEMSSPVFQLNSTEHITLEFDDLDTESKAYKYTIRHCESDWTTSADLMPAEYISGYREENISDFQYSMNTAVRYVHYQATFPGTNISPSISGNYLLIVYLDDPAEPVFTRRFMVTEVSMLSIEGAVHQGSKADEQLSKQQIDFEIRLNGFKVLDIKREIKVVVQQDDRWDNALRNISPRFIRGEELDYRYDENIEFNGGSPYRNFDIKTLASQTERIDKIHFDTANQVLLLPDKPRTYKNYVYDKDINGRFLIKNEVNAQNSAIEADYAWVHFFLPFPAELTNGEFYLMGALTDWRMDETSRLQFNSKSMRYEKVLFLKQGYYNYIYVMLKKGNTKGDEFMIEGSHWETPHIYTIYVYYRQTGAQTDQLIAVQNINSIQQN